MSFDSAFLLSQRSSRFLADLLLLFRSISVNRYGSMDVRKVVLYKVAIERLDDIKQK